MSKKADLHGVLLFDKPEGFTSNDAVQKVKGMLQARKAGHTGTLDPMATGMLVLCFGEGTRYAQHLLTADKHYTFTLKLGQATDTGDKEGTLTEQADIPIMEEKDWQALVLRFLGPQKQVPPMYSALKYQGRPLYEWARAGKAVPRPARDITVYSLRLCHFTADTATFDVRCSKGTYIRCLAEDMGQALGTVAHLTALRREAIPPFEKAHMHTLGSLEALSMEERRACLQPIEQALVGMMPRVQIAATQRRFLRNGQTVPIFAAAPAIGWVQVFEDDCFLGLGQMQGNGRLAPKKLRANLPESA